ncbi:(2Fe-2S)-binding protein [Nocardia cyriacigeorgica]|uniref:(2Fe-2S)-binding protein n=1 Tax=Nocardia cyriacigeorgica TaxID=135487 RepID=UPI002810AB3C|nr:(2Fe-2S)-binding protein [Nocardia cyriacigeorgica]
MSTVAGRMLTDPDWLTARIAEMGRSWGTDTPRVGATLWWCMVASALVEPLARAYAAGERAPVAQLDRIGCEVRPDGGVDRIVFAGSAESTAETVGSKTDLPDGSTDSSVDAGGSATGSCAGFTEDCAGVIGSAAGSAEIELTDAPDVPAISTLPDKEQSDAGRALRETLTAVIAQVAAVSGARAPALWAVVADAIGNRAIDAGLPEAGTRLAAEIGGRLPAPRFVDIGERTFVRRISCCLVYEVPGCQMCTSCPKRPSAERQQLLAELAARD